MGYKDESPDVWIPRVMLEINNRKIDLGMYGDYRCLAQIGDAILKLEAIKFLYKKGFNDRHLVTVLLSEMVSDRNLGFVFDKIRVEYNIWLQTNKNKPEKDSRVGEKTRGTIVEALICYACEKNFKFYEFLINEITSSIDTDTSLKVSGNKRIKKK